MLINLVKRFGKRIDECRLSLASIFDSAWWLKMLLLQAVKDTLGEDAVITGHHLTSFEQSNDKVVIIFENKKTGRRTYWILSGGYHDFSRWHSFYCTEILLSE